MYKVLGQVVVCARNLLVQYCTCTCTYKYLDIEDSVEIIHPHCPARHVSHPLQAKKELI